jgi:hypothetical protein
MANMRIIHTNVIDGAANLASSPACATGMPVGNIQLARRGSFARETSSTSWTISGEYSGAVSAMCIVGHNLTGSATVRLRLYSDYAKTTTVYDSTALPVWTPQVWGDPAASPNGGLEWGVLPWLATGILSGTPEYFPVWFTSVANGVAFTIDIVDTNNVDGYLQIGRVYLGEYWSPTVNDAYGLSMWWKEASKQVRTDGGSLRTEGYYPYRAYSCSFDAMDETDRGNFMEIIRKLGLRLDFFISFNPGAGGDIERDYMAACKFVTIPEMKHPAWGRFEAGVTMEEI